MPGYSLLGYLFVLLATAWMRAVEVGSSDAAIVGSDAAIVGSDPAIVGSDPATIVILLLCAALATTLCTVHHTLLKWLLPLVLSVLAGMATLMDPLFGILMPLPLFLTTSGILTASGRQDPVFLWITRLSPVITLLFVPIPTWPHVLFLGGPTVLVHLVATELLKQNAALSLERNELRVTVRQLQQQQSLEESHRRRAQAQAQTEERNRLAQQLHDGVGRTLSGSLMQLEAAQALTDRDPDRATLMTTAVRDSLRNGLDLLRQTVQGLKPPQEEMALQRLQMTLTRFRTDSEMRASLTCSGDLTRIRPLQWKIINENLEEALANVHRHARQATTPLSVSVQVAVLAKFLRVSIQDNGRGCILIRKGTGLTGIEERLAEGDGQLVLDGSQGFSLVMLLPLPAQMERPEARKEETHAHSTVDL